MQWSTSLPSVDSDLPPKSKCFISRSSSFQSHPAQSLIQTATVVEETSDVTVSQCLQTNVDAQVISMELDCVPADCLHLGMLEGLLVVSHRLVTNLCPNLIDMVIPLLAVLRSQLIMLTRHQHDLGLILVSFKAATPDRCDVRVTHSSSQGSWRSGR